MTPRFDSTYATSMSLIARAQQLDEEAWRKLTEFYGPLIYYWCRRAGLDGDDAADIFQEVFRALATHLVRFQKTQDSGSFRAWLWTITRNKIRDFHKVRQGKAAASGGSEAYRRISEIPAQEPDDLSGTHVLCISESVTGVIDVVRKEFQSQTWQAFWRTAVDGIPAAVVADELNLSLDSVYQAKSRVVRRIRKELGDYAELMI